MRAVCVLFFLFQKENVSFLHLKKAHESEGDIYIDPYMKIFNMCF